MTDTRTWAGLTASPESECIARCLVADACAEWGLPHLIHPARFVLFQLMLALRDCGPAEVRVAVDLRPRAVLLSVRTVVGDRHRPACQAPSRAPAHCRFEARPDGHLGWTRLDHRAKAHTGAGSSRNRL
jgi:hypothetical protein